MTNDMSVDNYNITTSYYTEQQQQDTTTATATNNNSNIYYSHIPDGAFIILTLLSFACVVNIIKTMFHCYSNRDTTSLDDAATAREITNSFEMTDDDIYGDPMIVIEMRSKKKQKRKKNNRNSMTTPKEARDCGVGAADCRDYVPPTTGTGMDPGVII